MADNRRQVYLPLDFIIVGGGLAGLAAALSLTSYGHRVRIFEKSSRGTAETSAGMRLTPNASRFLLQCGLIDEVDRRSCEIPYVEFIEMETGELVGFLGFEKEISEDLGAPCLSVAHQDLYDILHKAAIASGVHITTNAHVASVSQPPPIKSDAPFSPSSSTTPSVSPSSTAKPSITLLTGEVFSADIVIGADGIHGIVRSTIELEDDENLLEMPPDKTVIYTGIIPVESMLRDEKMKEVVGLRHVWWMGDGMAVTTHPVHNDRSWSITFWRDEEESDIEAFPLGWNTAIPPRTVIREALEHFEPRLSRMVDRVSNFARMHADLAPHAETWVDESERILLIGEAAHPLPLNGIPSASMALEDASTLGALFSHIRHRSQIPTLLYAFEEIRQPRTQAAHLLELANHAILRASPGPKRDAQNHAWGSVKEARLKQIDSSGAGVKSRADIRPEDREMREQWQELFEFWGYDPRDAAEEWWLNWGALEERALGIGSQADKGVGGFSIGTLSFQRVETVVSDA